MWGLRAGLRCRTRARGSRLVSALGFSSKAYERVAHKFLIDCAVKTKFPLDIIRLSRCINRRPRLLLVGHMASLPVLWQTIAAGCALVLLLPTLELATKRYQCAKLINVVDDITLEVRGSVGFVSDQTIDIVRYACRLLRRLT